MSQLQHINQGMGYPCTTVRFDLASLPVAPTRPTANDHTGENTRGRCTEPRLNFGMAKWGLVSCDNIVHERLKSACLEIQSLHC